MCATVAVGHAAPVNDVPPPPQRPQIIVRVAPRLLADALCLALRSEGLEIEQQYPDEPTRETVGQSRRFDLALLSDGLPSDIVAETILVLDPSGTTLSVVRKEQHRSIAFEGDLTHLIGMIERLLKDPVVGT
jgi:hypothetical protein